jgi:hypothetical protein
MMTDHRGSASRSVRKTVACKQLRSFYWRSWTYSKRALFPPRSPGAGRYLCRSVFPGGPSADFVADEALALGTTPRRKRPRAVIKPTLESKEWRHGVAVAGGAAPAVMVFSRAFPRSW